MRTTTILRGVLPGALLAAIFGIAQGCSGFSATAYCDKACDCGSCPASVRDVCVTQAEDARARAASLDCAVEFDAAFTCLSAGSCVDGVLDTSGCGSEVEALHSCDVWIAGANACYMYSAHVVARARACGVDVGDDHTGSPHGACSGSEAKLSACADACISEIDCDCMEGMFNLSAPANPDCDWTASVACNSHCTP